MREACGARGPGSPGENQRLLPRSRGPTGQVQQPSMVPGLQVRTTGEDDGVPAGSTWEAWRKERLALPALCSDNLVCKSPQVPSLPCHSSQKQGQLLTTKEAVTMPPEALDAHQWASSQCRGDST